MHPRLRLWLIGTLGVVLAVMVASGVAGESYLLARVLTLLILWLVVEWIGGPLPEAWVLAATLFGYIVGNRGFAQFSVTSDLPLLPAEAALLVTIPLLVIRLARKQVVALRRDWLNLALLGWCLMGTARIPLDLRAHGFLALRDFAMVYYAAFFFIAQALAGHAASGRLLRRTLTGAFIALVVCAIVDQLAPDFFLNLTVRGIPVIYYKSDLLAALLAAGFFWMWTRWEQSRHLRWLIPAGASFLLVGLTASPRAAMVALAVVTAMWLAARRWRIVVAQVSIVSFAAAVAVGVFALGNRNLRETKAYTAYEGIVSIFDYNGTGTYVTTHESGDPGDNNRFRMVWWRAVADETFEQNPVFGLGFGHDLASRFLADFGLIAADDFSARSPHSMIMSVFGRMGLAGLVLWLAVTAGMIGLTIRVFQQGNLDTIGLICVAWALWISGCFGIVLEGPMGAVVFWIVLGLASADCAAENISEPVESPVLAELDASGDNVPTI